MLTKPDSCKKVINDNQKGLFSIFYCILSTTNKNTVKFRLGSILNYSQVYQKQESGSGLLNIYDIIGIHGGLKHIHSGILRSINNSDYESVQYGIKILMNLSKSNEISYISVKEVGVLDLLCLCISKVQDGLKSQDQID